CIGCYHCVAVCPSDAVTCDEFPLKAFRKIPKDKAPSAAAVNDLLVQRRSIREFKNKEVPKKVLDELVEIVSHAPTGSNSRGVGLSIITDQKLINKMDARILKTFDKLTSLVDNPVASSLVASLGGKKNADRVKRWKGDLERYKKAKGAARLHAFRGAPVLVVAHSGSDSSTGRDDCVIALAHLNIAAEARGMGCTWIGYLVAAAKLDPHLKRVFGVPKNRALNAAMILGWPKYKYKRVIPRKAAPIKWIG
ncbi:MAG: nitroreductase family protein, partial [bacterium]